MNFATICFLMGYLTPLLSHSYEGIRNDNLPGINPPWNGELNICKYCDVTIKTKYSNCNFPSIRNGIKLNETGNGNRKIEIHFNISAVILENDSRSDVVDVSLCISAPNCNRSRSLNDRFRGNVISNSFLRCFSFNILDDAALSWKELDWDCKQWLCLLLEKARFGNEILEKRKRNNINSAVFRCRDNVAHIFNNNSINRKNNQFFQLVNVAERRKGCKVDDSALVNIPRDFLINNDSFENLKMHFQHKDLRPPSSKKNMDKSSAFDSKDASISPQLAFFERKSHKTAKIAKERLNVLNKNKIYLPEAKTSFVNILEKGEGLSKKNNEVVRAVLNSSVRKFKDKRTIWKSRFKRNVHFGKHSGYVVQRIRRRTHMKPLEVVLGKSVFMPCDVSPRLSGDSPQLLMWLKEGIHTPLFSVDFREGSQGRPQIWKDTTSSIAQRSLLHLITRPKSSTFTEKEQNFSYNRFDKESIQNLDANKPLETASSNTFRFVQSFDPAVAGVVDEHNLTGGLEVSSVKFADAGVYRCRVDFLHSPTRNARLNLTVIVPPKSVEIFRKDQNIWKRVEGDSVGLLALDKSYELKCTTTPAFPTPRVLWLDEDSVIETPWEVKSFQNESKTPTFERERILQSSITYLTLSNLDRNSHLKKLSCAAGNTNLTVAVVRSVKLKLILPVLSLHLDPVLPIAAQESAEVQCTAWGSNPPPKIRWTLGGFPFTASQTWVSDDGNVSVSIISLKASADQDGATVSCSAFNPLSSFRTHVANLGENPNHTKGISQSRLLTVYYKPKVNAWLGKSLNRSQIKEGDDVYFECEILAKPKINLIEWSHMGKPLLEGNNILISNMTLVLQKVNRSQAGNYVCRAANTIGSATSSPVSLDIKYSPVCATDESKPYSVAKGENARIACNVLSNPVKASFTWTFNNTAEVVNVPVDRYATDGLESIVNYTPMTELDYGTLLCWAKNEIGTQNTPCVFQILAAGKPEPPHNCQLKEVTLSSIKVSCLPGDDGGAGQTFLLQIMENGDSGVVILDVTERQPSFSVSNLLPGTPYRLVITATNRRGESKPTHLTLRTLSLHPPRHESSAEPTRGRESNGIAEIQLGAIVGGILVISLLVLAIGGFVVKVCIDRRKRAMENLMEKISQEEEDRERKRSASQEVDVGKVSGTQENVRDEDETVMLLKTDSTPLYENKTKLLDERRHNIHQSSYRSEKPTKEYFNSALPPPSEYNQGYSSVEVICVCSSSNTKCPKCIKTSHPPYSAQTVMNSYDIPNPALSGGLPYRLVMKDRMQNSPGISGLSYADSLCFRSTSPSGLERSEAKVLPGFQSISNCQPTSILKTTNRPIDAHSLFIKGAGNNESSV